MEQRPAHGHLFTGGKDAPALRVSAWEGEGI
jgi:hypothetical protein